jgi:predicted permease
MTSDLPATGPASVLFKIRGKQDLATNQDRSTLDSVVTPDYFRIARIPLQRGRAFTEQDNATAPRVVLVNQEFVSHFLPGEEPLGKQIQLEVSGTTPEWSEIVGVVSNVKTFSESTTDDPQVYEPFLQRPVATLFLMIRATGNPNVLAADLRNSVAQVDADLPVARVMSMSAVIDRQKAGNPFFSRVLGVFAVLALILAVIGIYGLIAYSVGQRKREIGIRMALGAGRMDVLRMILGQGFRLTVIGLVIGLVLALPLPKVLSSMFVDLQVQAFWLYLIVPPAILLIALPPMYIPAWRAAKIDPTTALHHE